MIQSVSFSSAAFGAFAESYLCFLVYMLLRNRKKMSGRKKKFFFGRRKAVFLHKKVICLSNLFQTWFYNSDHLLYYPQMSVFSFHTFHVNPSYNRQKFNNKMNEKWSQGYHSMDPEYVTGQINIHILELLLDDFGKTLGRFNMWVTNRPSFCIILKRSHALDDLFSVLSSLHGYIYI